MDDNQLTRVLIAEDDFLVGEMIEGALDDMGYIVIGKATNGRQAVELTQSLRPDVVIMDIEMPSLGGLEALRQIYEQCPTPTVVLTAYNTPHLVKKASAAGAGAYLIKPPNVQEMERAIMIAIARFGDLLELRRLNNELQQQNETLQAALAKVKQLSGLLPICASCKKIRDDAGYWHQVEVYIQNHSEADFSHGVCPDCIQTLYPELFQEIIDRKEEIIGILANLGPTDVATVAQAVGLPESNTLNRLRDMVNAGQLRQIKVGEEFFYDLLLGE